MMAPIGKIIPNGKVSVINLESPCINNESDELKEEPPDRGFHEEVQIKLEKDDDSDIEEIHSYQAMNEDEGIIIKREDSDDSLEDEKPDIDILEDGGRKIVMGDEKNCQFDNADDSARSLLCKFCGKQFFRAHYFNLHIKTHQSMVTSQNHDSIYRPHKCQECGKSFALLQHLAGHSRIHIAGQYYECPVCRRKFTELSNLTMHLLKTHPDEKPYKCSECDKQFTQASALKKHLRTHSNTSQEELDRIDTMFYISSKGVEEPLRKKIKIEKEESSITPGKERRTPPKDKPVVQRGEKSSKDVAAPLNKVKSPPRPKSTLSLAKLPENEKLTQVKDVIQLDESLVVKAENLSMTKVMDSDESHPVKPSSFVISSSSDQPSEDNTSYIKEEPADPVDEAPASPSQEVPSLDGNASAFCETVLLVPLKGRTLPERKQLQLIVNGDDGTESNIVNYSIDSLPLRNGVPLDLVQNPLIKVTKYSKAATESEPFSLKGQPNVTSPLKFVSGSNENNVESQECLEETENSNHSGICNGDRSFKGKATTPFVSLSRNKSDLFTSWIKNKSENRAPLPSLVKPDCDYDVRFKCHRCDIFLESEEKLHDHLTDHTGVELHECRFCGKNFTTMTSLKRHLYYHVVGSIPQNCTRCDETFVTFRDLKDHCSSNKCEVSSNSAKFKCFKCRKHMSSLKKLKMHLLSQCSEEPTRYYFPKKSDTSLKEISDPQKGNDNGGGSEAASVTSRNEWVSQKFEKTSVWESDMQGLNLEANDVEALQVLGKLGRGEKGRDCWNLQCQGCGQKFENVEKAKVHSQLGCQVSSGDTSASSKETMKIKVVFEENEDFQCSLNCVQCDKRIVGVEKMLLHIQEHIYEKNNMICPVLKCGKSFKNPGDFKLHLKAHTGHKPYKCSDCGKRFFLRENYENHAQRHGILKNWSSLNGAYGEKLGNVSSAAGRSPITIESSIINLEVGEADVDKKMISTAGCADKTSSDPPEIRRRKEDKVLQTFNARSRVPTGVKKHIKASPAMNKPIAVNRPSPLGRPSTAVNKPLSAPHRTLPPVVNRPSPVPNRPAPVISKPAPVTSSPSVLPPPPLPPPPSLPLPPPLAPPPQPPPVNEPCPRFNGDPPVLGRMGHSSGGSFSVTAQGIFSVGPSRTYPGPIPPGTKPVLNKPGYHPIASKPSLVPKEEPMETDEYPQSHSPPYFRVSEHSRANIQAANAELRKYPRSGRCEVCKKICSRLDKHMMVHLNQKPHLCPVCPQAFRQSEHLRRHIRARHEGNHRQFQCPQCYKRLTRKDKLKEHMKNCSRIMENGTIHTLGDSLFDMIPGPSHLEHYEPFEIGHTTA